MNTRNYLSTRYRDHHTQRAHDDAFFRVLILLLFICLVAALVGKAYGQDEPRTEIKDEPKAAAPTPSPSPAPAPATPAPSVKPKASVVKPEFKPTDDEAKDGRIIQLEATNAQKDWNAASQKLPEYQVFNDKVNALVGWCRKVEKSHGWPADVGCDINQNPIPFMKSDQQQAKAKAAASAPAPVQDKDKPKK